MTILLAAEGQKRGYQIYYFEPENLSFLNGRIMAFCKHIKINDNEKKFYSILKTVNLILKNQRLFLSEMILLLIIVIYIQHSYLVIFLRKLR